MEEAGEGGGTRRKRRRGGGRLQLSHRVLPKVLVILQSEIMSPRMQAALMMTDHCSALAGMAAATLDLQVLDAGRMQLVHFVVADVCKPPPPPPRQKTQQQQQPFIETCTICGEQLTDKTAFNAHIRAHLKEKLHRRREEEEQKQNRKRSRTAAAAAAATTAVTTAAVPAVTDNNAPTAAIVPIPTHSEVMAELAACKPVIPPPQTTTRSPAPTQLPRHHAPAPAPLPVPVSAPAPAPATVPPLVPVPVPAPAPVSTPAPLQQQLPPPPNTTPEISDLEDDLMSYEMELNRIDFNRDLSCILDQIEKDLALPNLGLDTPPDSDSENNADYLLMSPPSSILPPIYLDLSISSGPDADLLGFDAFARRLLNGGDVDHSAVSGGDNKGPRDALISSSCSAGEECIVEELSHAPPPPTPSRVGALPESAAVDKQQPGKKFFLPLQSSEQGKAKCKAKQPATASRVKHACKQCPKSFWQKCHLSRHEKMAHGHGNATNDDLRCRLCSKLCKSRLSLSRHHRSKHHHFQKNNVEHCQGQQQHASNNDCWSSSSSSSSDTVGESLADISNSNLFHFAQELNDEIYSTDLF